MTVARNHCLDVLRRRKRLGSALALLAADGRGAPNCDVAVIDRQLLAAVLHELGKRDRLVLWQSAVERRPLGEIASYLGLSYMAAAQLRHRARTRASMIAARLAALLGILASHVSRIRSAQALEAQGIPAKDAAATLKQHPYYVGKLYQQARNYSPDELREVTVRLAQLDHALKGGSRLAADLELERALIEITQPRSRA